MNRLGALAAGIGAAVSLSGCASLGLRQAAAPECPAGQERLRMAQIFFGRDMPGAKQVSNDAFRKFVDEELTPRFPHGLTILDGGGQWRGAENRLIREASKVVMIVLPKDEGAMGRIADVQAAYKIRFSQESVLTVTQPACVSF